MEVHVDIRFYQLTDTEPIILVVGWFFQKHNLEYFLPALKDETMFDTQVENQGNMRRAV